MWHQAVLLLQPTPVEAARAENAKATLLLTTAVHRAPAPNMYVHRAALRVHPLQAPTVAARQVAAIIETAAQVAQLTGAIRQAAATTAAAHPQEALRQAQAAAQAATVVEAVARVLAREVAVVVQAAVAIAHPAVAAVLAVEEDKFHTNPNN